MESIDGKSHFPNIFISTSSPGFMAQPYMCRNHQIVKVPDGTTNWVYLLCMDVIRPDRTSGTVFVYCEQWIGLCLCTHLELMEDRIPVQSNAGIIQAICWGYILLSLILDFSHLSKMFTNIKQTFHLVSFCLNYLFAHFLRFLKLSMVFICHYHSGPQWGFYCRWLYTIL